MISVATERNDEMEAPLPTMIGAPAMVVADDDDAERTGGSRERIVRYYAAAGPDYGAWSPDFNMHFGFFRRGLNPCNREAMLCEMTRQVLCRLGLDLDTDHRLVDLGCGLGAGARLAAREHPLLQLDAVTLVPWQARQARAMARAEGLASRIAIHTADYTRTPFCDRAFDGAFAIESACHAAGDAKERFTREASRLLATGRRLVVADGFRKSTKSMPAPLAWCYRRVCANWALESFAEIGAFTDGLTRHGFRDIRVEDISWRIAPSVMHVPWVTLGFLLGALRRDGLRLGPDRWGHLLACVLSPIVGMARRHFGYFLVTATRAP